MTATAKVRKIPASATTSANAVRNATANQNAIANSKTDKITSQKEVFCYRFNYL